jgi:hypothetical protein
MSAIHPDEMLRSLIAKGCRSDKKHRLEKLHEICRAEYNGHSEGARDLSVANIARIAESHNLIKNQKTLYNAQSADYVALINVWAAHSGPKQALVSKRAKAAEDKYSIVDQIADPAVRSYCLIALAERDKLRNEINMLKATTVWTVDIRKTAGLRLPSTEPVPELALTDSEERALKLALEPKRLEARRWRETEGGGIVDERGKPIFEPGFALVIRRILKAASHTKEADK